MTQRGQTGRFTAALDERRSGIRAQQRHWSALCFSLLVPALANAETIASVASPDVPPVGFSVLRVFGALLLVLAVFFGGVWLFKNWQRASGVKTGACKLSILEVKSLGNRHALYVVGYDKQRVLLASSPTGVNLVSQLPEALDGEMVPTASPSFAATLQGLLNRKP